MVQGLIPPADDLYRLHLSAPPQQLLQEILQRAGSFPQDFSFEIKHHLTPQQAASLAKVARQGRAKSLILSASPETEYHRDGNANENTLIAALYGWQVNASGSSNSSTITPATTTASDPAPSVIVQCKLCARRLAVKGARSTTSDASPANSITEEGTIRSPDKLSSVDLASSHRRFCPYINPVSDSAQQKLGYKALLDRILQIDNHSSPDHVTFEPSVTDRSKSNVRQVSRYSTRACECSADQIILLEQTREALRYVKDLLEGGHAVKRKFSVS